MVPPRHPAITRAYCSYLFTQLVKDIPLNMITHGNGIGSATITLRNELGKSVVVRLDKSNRGDIFKGIRRAEREDSMLGDLREKGLRLGIEEAEVSEGAWLG